MAQIPINISGTATQMVNDINDNFDELYHGAGGAGGSAERDHTETLSSNAAVYLDKKMGISSGKLTFSASSTGRKIFCIDIDADAVAYKVPTVSADNSALSYAFVDDEDNVIASAALGTTGVDADILVSLDGVSKVYISKASSATSASLEIYSFGENVSEVDKVEANMSTRLVVLNSSEIAVTSGGYFTTAANNLAKIIVIPIAGCKTIEGYGKVRNGTRNWVILDKHLKVLKTNWYPTYYDSMTYYQHIPDGARFLACLTDTNDSDSAKNANYTLLTHIPKIEYNILVLGNSFTQCYWAYVPAILEHLFGDDCKVTILCGMAGASTFSSWKDWLTGSDTKEIWMSICGEWRKYGLNQTAQQVFNMMAYDLVGFQQQSNNSMTYSSWSGSWMAAVKAVSQLNTKNVDFMWTMVHSKPASADVTDSDTTMESIIAAHESMSQDFDIDICPVGTAIQNARHTGINNLGWEGSYGQLTPDNQHLQKGFACFIASWVVVRYICKKLGINVPCYGDKMDVDAEFDATYKRLTDYGTTGVYASSESMVFLAQRCVEAALRFPFEIKTNVSA